MIALLVLVVAIVVTIAALTIPVAIRDRRRAPAGYAGLRRRPSGPYHYDRFDGVSAYGAGGFGGGFDAGGAFGGGGFSGDGGGGGD